MADFGSAQKEVTKLSLLSISAACVLAAQTVIMLLIMLIQPQGITFSFILQMLIPLAILVMNCYALFLSLKHPEYDRRIPIIGASVSLVIIVYMFTSFLRAF